MKCRFCDSRLDTVFADLGSTPLANSYLSKEDLNKKEKVFPLIAYVCSKCLLVQLDEIELPTKIFSNYAYFSSFSKTWLEHAKDFAHYVINRFSLNSNSMVVEIASNDGYLLQNFKEKNIAVLGVEPATNVALVAEEKKIPTVNKFFSQKTAMDIKSQGIMADILVAFNVLPHVPNINDVVIGMNTILKFDGVLIIQFSAYMIPLVTKTLFDMIYHEHYSYFSLYTIKKILESHNLEIFDCEELSIHGGSLRIYVKHKESKKHKIKPTVKEQLRKEQKIGLHNLSIYKKYQEKIIQTEDKINDFISTIKDKKIVAYGAPAKGNTLLNFCQIDPSLIMYTVDVSHHKQGLFLPGSHIPIYSPEKIFETKPDYVFILAWNLKDEIMEQMNKIKEWNGKFFILLPEVEVYS